MLGFSSLQEEERFHHKLCMLMIYLSPATFVFLRFVFPPNWGKNFSTLLGPTVPPRLAWCLFEIPNLYWSFLCYLRQQQQGSSSLPTANTILLALFVGHYVNRSIVYPLTLNPHTKRIPLEIVLSAHLYTNVNGYLQAQALCQFYTYPDDSLVRQARFWLGLMLFGTGVAINWQSDAILRHLRSSNNNNKSQKCSSSSSGYVIPYGGLFRFVSAPHYLGEILEWLGFAMAGQSWAAWSFFTFTCANLIPRGLAHHEWYQKNFKKDYPVDRKAVIPFLW